MMMLVPSEIRNAGTVVFSIPVSLIGGSASVAGFVVSSLGVFSCSLSTAFVEGWTGLLSTFDVTCSSMVEALL